MVQTLMVIEIPQSPYIWWLMSLLCSCRSDKFQLFVLTVGMRCRLFVALYTGTGPGGRVHRDTPLPPPTHTHTLPPPLPPLPLPTTTTHHHHQGSTTLHNLG